MKKLFALIASIFKKKIPNPEHNEIGLLPTPEQSAFAKMTQDILEATNSRKAPKNYGHPQVTLITFPPPKEPHTNPLIDGYTPYSSIVSKDHFTIVIRLDGYVLPELGFKLGEITFDKQAEQIIVDKVFSRYLKVNVHITTDMAAYYNAPKGKRAIISVGNSNGRDVGFGGMTYKYQDGVNDGFAVVYWDRMNGIWINAAEEIAHEAGHAAFGLGHHMTYVNCVPKSPYLIPATMSNPFGNQPGLIKSTHPTLCTGVQDDLLICTTKAGIRPGQTI